MLSREFYFFRKCEVNIKRPAEKEKSQEDTKNIPVIMVSASPGLAEMAKSAGADDYLEKPFHLKELLATVEKYV